MRTIAAALLLLMLAACGSQQAGYEIDGNNHSLSVTRSQNYPGALWETHLVVSRFPECQRRYELKSTGDKFKMDVYRFAPNQYVLNQGKRWYVAETGECRWDQFKEAPPEPGSLVGTFVIRDDALLFKKSEEEEAAEAKAASKKKEGS